MLLYLEMIADFRLFDNLTNVAETLLTTHCQIERYPTTVKTHMILLLTAVYAEICLEKNLTF